MHISELLLLAIMASTHYIRIHKRFFSKWIARAPHSICCNLTQKGNFECRLPASCHMQPTHGSIHCFLKNSIIIVWHSIINSWSIIVCVVCQTQLVQLESRRVVNQRVGISEQMYRKLVNRPKCHRWRWYLIQYEAFHLISDTCN